ncbi:MAG: peptide-methionine (S)-S-oxide reductase MsrA [Gammaproteobacteria bacterium]|nr:peptide-methionine (S)-S-oxide reductase MsrA [Gammaproteobacteria bacterium]
MWLAFGGGCFWGVEPAFRKLDAGYWNHVGFMVGHAAHPTYRQVCGGDTGHAEVVQVEFDPMRLSYERLLELFWDIHDPTQVDRQGPDVGRSIRLGHLLPRPEQEAAARADKAAEESASGHIEAGSRHRSWQLHHSGAEEYHQQYLEKRGLASCHAMLA